MSFDESLNKVMQISQMDLVVRFWNTTEIWVSVWCWDSNFLGNTRADTILVTFNDYMSTLDPNKMIQISVDGLSTNWKLMESLKRNRLENEQSQLIEIASCGLHIVHRPYKTGAESTDWELKKILKGTFTPPHDSPARRYDYISLTGSNTFPLFFCATRWNADAEVADQLINIWENVTKIVRFQEKLPNSKQLSCKSFLSIQSAMNKFVVSKLQFFRFVGSLFQPFLTVYQTDWPVLSFMYGDLIDMVKNLLQLLWNRMF